MTNYPKFMLEVQGECPMCGSGDTWVVDPDPSQYTRNVCNGCDVVYLACYDEGHLYLVDAGPAPKPSYVGPIFSIR